MASHAAEDYSSKVEREGLSLAGAAAVRKTANLAERKQYAAQ